MSYSYARNFRTKVTAKAEIEKVPDSSLPSAVKELILTALGQMQPDGDNTFITVQASGHWDHDIKVRQQYF